MITHRKLVGLLLGTALVASACSGSVEVGDGDTAAPPTAEVAAPPPAAAEPVSYCDSLGDAFALEADETAYINALEETAAIAEPEQQAFLEELVAAGRSDEPTSDFEEFAKWIEQGIEFAEHARDTCGLTMPGVNLEAFDADETDEADDAPAETASEPEFIKSIPEGTPAEPPRSIISGDEATVLTAVNAGVPADADLSFAWESVTGDQGRVMRALVPANWVMASSLFGSEFTPLVDQFTPTNFELGSKCQGFCAAQDWRAEVLDNPDVGPFGVSNPDEITLMVDQELSNPSGRLMVWLKAPESDGEFEINPSIEVTLVRYSNEADAYLECEAHLFGDDMTLWPTFADACIAASATWFEG